MLEIPLKTEISISTKQQQPLFYKSQYSHFEKFINSLGSNATKKLYEKQLKYFLTFSKLEKYSDLVDGLNDDEKHEIISDYITFLKTKRENSNSTVRVAFATIKKFYTINRVKLDWDYLTHFKGKSKGKKIDDRLYSKKEIEQLLLHADLREKVMIYCLLSTGMRVGGLAEIRIKDMTWIEEYKIYKFKVYADSDDSNDRYTTFCTPECANIIKKYLGYRELKGDTIKPNSSLIYRKHTIYDRKNNKAVCKDLFHLPLDGDGIGQIISRLQRKSMVASRQKENGDHKNIGRIRKEMMRCHAFRKMFNTICIKNNMNHSVKEKLMGHKKEQELDFNYNRMEDSELLQQYLKVINDLTINDEYRLIKENQELKKQDDYQKYLIDKKLAEKDQKIEQLEQTANSYGIIIKQVIKKLGLECDDCLMNNNKE